jgi:hypothetical protein
MNDQYEF